MRWVITALALYAAGCGAKTGLGTPGGGAPDDSIDASVPPDAAALPDGTLLPDGDVSTACHGADVVFRYDDEGQPVPQSASLSARVRIPQADVYFLFDTTGSMFGEIAAMRVAVLDLIDMLQCPAGGPRCSDDRDCADDERCSPEGRCGPAPEVAGCLPDMHVGVGRYAGTSDSYRHLHDVAPPTAATADAVPGRADGRGGSEALYQSVACVIGMGRCPSAMCTREGRGCGGFRNRALPIVVTLTDEGDECTYAAWFVPECAETQVSAGSKLRTFGAVHVGIDADIGREATPFLEALAEEARSFDADGDPLVFQGSEGDVVDAVRTGLVTVASSPLRLTVELEDLPDDDGDALALVDHIEVDTDSPGCFPYRDLEDIDRDGHFDAVAAAGPGTTGCFSVFPRDERFTEGGTGERRFTARLRAGGAVVDELEVCFALD